MIRVGLIERGNTFGYQDLVVDYRNITWMKEIGRARNYGLYPFPAAAQPNKRCNRW